MEVRRRPSHLEHRRWLRKGTLLDHEALLDIVYIKEMPIDQERILQSPIPVIVTASDVDSGEATYRDLRDGHVIQWIKATGRLPFAAGPPVEIDGRRYLDGGILDAIPIQRAVADGHDLVTLILNKRPGRYKKDNPIIAKIAAARYPKLRHGILRHQEHKNEAMHYARNPPPGVAVRIIRPEVPTHLHRLSRDLSVLEAAIDQGRYGGRRHIDKYPAPNPGANMTTDSGP